MAPASVSSLRPIVPNQIELPGATRLSLALVIGLSFSIGRMRSRVPVLGSSWYSPLAPATSSRSVFVRNTADTGSPKPNVLISPVCVSPASTVWPIISHQNRQPVTVSKTGPSPSSFFTGKATSHAILNLLTCRLEKPHIDYQLFFPLWSICAGQRARHPNNPDQLMAEYLRRKPH